MTLSERIHQEVYELLSLVEGEDLSTVPSERLEGVLAAARALRLELGKLLAAGEQEAPRMGPKPVVS